MVAYWWQWALRGDVCWFLTSSDLQVQYLLSSWSSDGSERPGKEVFVSQVQSCAGYWHVKGSSLQSRPAENKSGVKSDLYFDHNSARVYILLLLHVIHESDLMFNAILGKQVWNRLPEIILYVYVYIHFSSNMLIMFTEHIVIPSECFLTEVLTQKAMRLFFFFTSMKAKFI